MNVMQDATRFCWSFVVGLRIVSPNRVTENSVQEDVEKVTIKDAPQHFMRLKATKPDSDLQ